ncbi:hypothetical protein G7Y89_g8815 [Cudoniella acicularis]|uniref:Acyl-CoA thioesterase II n=1 Tax=Cudoniella acicularis TaxID=354080 RepID=A0A8H4RFV7_9HELO|nr:hypothetical protein G7Y89_g8815 [Cudoniella acicularis]
MVYDLTVGTARNPVIVIICFTVFALLTTILRIQSKWMRKAKVASDDYLIIIALLLIVLSETLQISAVVVSGLGRHAGDVSPSDIITLLKINFGFRLLYGIEVALVKLAIISFYFRLFSSRDCFRVAAWIVISLTVLWALADILAVFLLCMPLSMNWDMTGEGVCLNRTAMYYSLGAINIFTDITLLVLPLPYILGLRLENKRKFGILAMFSFGIFNTAVSILRMRALITANGGDITFTLARVFMWTLLDPCVLIITANLPMVRTYFMLVAPHIFGSSMDSSNQHRMLEENRLPRFMAEVDDRFGSDLSDQVRPKPFGTKIVITGGKGAIDDMFTNTRPLWHPPGARGIYGGAVIAQCLAAAQRTVPSNFTVHSMHCYFVLAGDATIPVMYYVEHVREGRSFATRTVQARQRGKAIFTTTMSFARENSGGKKTVEHAVPLPSDILPPGDGPDQESGSGPFMSRRIEILNKESKNPHEKKTRQWIKARGRISDAGGHQAHLSALAYMSDSYFIGTVSRIHDLWRFGAPANPTSSKSETDSVTKERELYRRRLKESEGVDALAENVEGKAEIGMMVSLDHSIYFHEPRRFRADEWMFTEMSSPWSGDGRGVVQQHMFAGDGTLVATCFQEGVVRLKDELVPIPKTSKL